MAKENKIWTIIELLKWGNEYFVEKKIESPRLTMELLLCHVLNLGRIDLYTRFEQPLNENELSSLKSCIKRKVSREPIQYIIGKTEFFGLNISLDRNVLIPRPETEFLVNFILENEKNSEEKLSVLDIGTGSGCISLALAKFLNNSYITTIDNSESAINAARKNAECNSIGNVTFQQKDIFSTEFDGNSFDIIVSNPPYIPLKEYLTLEPEVLEYEPRQALTDESDGLTFYRRFADIFGNILKSDGKFYLEIGFGQSDSIMEIFQKAGFVVEFSKDYAGIDRIAYNIVI